MATPRDLDPNKNVKFSEESPDAVRTDDETLWTDKEAAEPEGGNIVYRQPVINPDGTAGEKLHGPMPVGEWAAYERKNKL